MSFLKGIWNQTIHQFGSPRLWANCMWKVFLNISQNSQENTCVGVSFLKKLQTCRGAIKKETSPKVSETRPANFAKFLRMPFVLLTFHRVEPSKYAMVEPITAIITARKVYVFWVILVRIFPHSDWIRRFTPYLSLVSPNAGKYGPE